jgi:hypothetical protein
MNRRMLLSAAMLAACAEPTSAAPRNPAQPESPSAHTSARAERTGNNCSPFPREGTPCGPGDSYCVITWGEPGGWSAALWCRNGRWELEEERNLPSRD